MPRKRTLTLVKSPDQIKADIAGTASAVLVDWVKDHNPSVANVILVAMAIVEKYSGEISQLGSKDKLDAARSLIPIIIDACVSAGKINENDGETLKMRLVALGELFEDIAAAYISVSKNPGVIQFELAVKEKVSSCFSRCRSKNNN
jgi:hypothetical protein